MMLSPEALVLQGNFAGMRGMAFVGPMIIVLVVHALNARSGHETSDIGKLVATLGSFAAAWLLLAARPAVAICLATAVLVSAGYVFNEVFVYWFPNFGFAFLMLAALCLLNLAGPQFASRVQVLFVAAALIGLAALALAGLSDGDAPAALQQESAIFRWRAWGLAAIAFIGYDLVGDSAPNLAPAEQLRITIVGLSAAGFVLGVWNAAALLHVEPSRLAETSIPHVLAARAILDATGRVLIGIVTIAGAAAAVNVLFQTLGRTTAVMANEGLMPAVFARPQLTVVVISAATGISMASGFAGSDLLDDYLRAGLILWLITMGLRHLAPLRGGGPEGAPRKALTTGDRICHLALLVIMPLLASIPVWTDDDPVALGATILILAASAAGVAAIGLFATRVTLRKAAAEMHN